MAALASLGGYIALSLSLSAAVDSEKRAVYQRALLKAIQVATSTGSGPGDCDMAWFDEVDLTASQAAADTIDLTALSQGGNSQSVAKGKWLVAVHLSGDGTIFIDRGATNGYTGIPADGMSCNKNYPVVVFPLMGVATSGSVKTIATSETAGATGKFLIVILGASA